MSINIEGCAAVMNKQQYEKKLRTLNKRFEWFEKRFEKQLREYEETQRKRLLSEDN